MVMGVVVLDLFMNTTPHVWVRVHVQACAGACVRTCTAIHVCMSLTLSAVRMHISGHIEVTFLRVLWLRLSVT